MIVFDVFLKALVASEKLGYALGKKAKRHSK